MKKAEMKPFREQLLSLRSRLRGDVSSMADAALRKSGMEGGETNSMPIHMAELGSENFEQEFTLTLMQSEEGTLGAIDEALHRIDQGSYGICQECAGVIPKLRLAAIPFTPMCVKCAEKLENGS
jgi:DnaK suppressor protein